MLFFACAPSMSAVALTVKANNAERRSRSALFKLRAIDSRNAALYAVRFKRRLPCDGDQLPLGRRLRRPSARRWMAPARR